MGIPEPPPPERVPQVADNTPLPIEESLQNSLAQRLHRNLVQKAASVKQDVTETEEEAELVYQEPGFSANDYFKHSSHLKTSVYPAKNNTVLLRVQNLADKFDGVAGSATHMFDVNAWAREFYYEANAHLVPANGSLDVFYENLYVNVTEMTLGGFISKQQLLPAEMQPQEPENPAEPELFPPSSPEVMEAQVAKWTTLDDPEMDNDGTNDFNLTLASVPPHDTIREIWTSVAQHTSEMVHVVALEP